MSDARSCSNHCHTFDDYNGGQWMHEGGDRKWHGERRSYCWRSRQELMVVDGQPHIVDMLKLPTRTSTPEAVAEALAVVLEAWGVPGVGASVADRGKTYNVVDIDARVLVSAGGSRLSGDVWIDRLNEFGMLEAHGCTLAEARALRGVEEGD